MDFGSMMTAMVTPFDHAGEFHEAAIQPLVDHLIETGTTTIVAVGTTGESPTLSHAEKLRVFEATLRAVDGRIPVIAGSGNNATKESIELSTEAVRLGVQGVLLVAPYYNKPTQEGLHTHFSAIADAINAPVVLYNVPSRTGVNIDAETVLQLAQVPNIVAVKEASGNFAQIAHIAAEKPDDFLLYSGDDKYTLPMLSLGAAGVVSVASHIVGREMKAMMDLFWQGQTDEAALWSARLLPIFESMFATPNPGPVKAALSIIGHDVGSVRLPLLPVSDTLKVHLQELLHRLGGV